MHRRSIHFSLGVLMWLLWALFIGAVVAGLVAYGDHVQKRERQDHGAAVAAVLQASQPSMDELVARVRAELEAEMAERMTDAISDVQDSIFAAVSQVLAEARGQAVGGAAGFAGDGSPTAPIRGVRRGHTRLQWDETAKAWTDGERVYV